MERIKKLLSVEQSIEMSCKSVSSESSAAKSVAVPNQPTYVLLPTTCLVLGLAVLLYRILCRIFA